MAKSPVTGKNQSRRLGCIAWGIAAAAVVLPLCGVLLIFGSRPSLAGQGADVLRAVLGDEAVASLEMIVFQAQDAIQKIEFSMGFTTPEAPWQAAPVKEAVELASANPSQTPAPVLSVTPFWITPSQIALSPTEAVAEPALQPTPTAASSPAPAVSPAPTTWQPAPLAPLGALEGEGHWSPYIQDTSGRTVAYRAYLQPDANRPFAVVAVIAFDLEHTRLHFVLGFEEPYSPGGPRRSGAMPEADKTPGRLLAIFNGGFKATHGHFGAMAGGVTALPARDGLGTLVIEQDGKVRMGVWGSPIQPAPDAQAWRQNGPLVIQDGKINPRIYNNSPKDWGYTVNDVSPTWRSGIGISADGRTLFYFAGSSLTMEALAKSMLAAGAAQGMQLDINTYWVHFVAVQNIDGELSLEPLFPAMMKDNVKRYLYPYSRDYFYVTSP